MFNKDFFDDLIAKAGESERLRQNYDLRNSNDDFSQRMFNALLPGTIVPIHKHSKSSETVVCIKGKVVELFFEEHYEYERDINGDVMRKKFLKEVERYELSPSNERYGIQVPKGVWHTIEVLEPSVILEVKDGKYGEDGTIML